VVSVPSLNYNKAVKFSINNVDPCRKGVCRAKQNRVC
jgi:hypothetical protein